LLRIQKRHGAPRARVEGCRVKSPVLALHGHDVPSIRAADAAAPLSCSSPHRGKA
jgi:hypothetical protein